MSDGMNRVVLLGNLGADPELRYAASGVAVLTFRLATNESFVDRNRQVAERTEWHSVAMFGARAEGLSRVLTKGSCVLVEGTLRTTSYEKDGQKRYRTEVHARDICFAGGSPAGMRVEPSAVRRDVDDEIGSMDAPLPSEEGDVGVEPPAPPRAPRKRNGSASRKAELLDEMPF